jgi:hypothetical protein
MASRRASPRGKDGPTSTLAWWFRPSPALLWRLPLIVVAAVLAAWYAFRGLVHLAFLFDAYPVVTFLVAPVALPFGAAPALCFVAVIVGLPALWRRQRWSRERLALVTLASPFVALIAAQMLDLIQINIIRMIGIPLPRLPLDPY